MDAGGAGRGGRQHDLGARHRELAPMMLPHAEERESQLIRQLRLRDHVADGLRLAQQHTVLVRGHVTESVESELHCVRHERLPFHSHACNRRPSPGIPSVLRG